MHLSNRLCMAVATAGFVCIGAVAQAAPGYVVQGVNLRAGPGTDYPVVAQLPPGTPTEIYGCLPGWTWCDIGVNGPEGAARGWAAGVTLQVVYENRPAPLAEYGGEIGLPFVGFSVGPYWDRYYRDRPFYGTEDRWRGRDFGGGPGYGGPRPPPPPFRGGDFGRGPAEFHPGGPPEFRGPPGGPGGPPGGFGGRGPIGNVGAPPPPRREPGPPGGFQHAPPSPHPEPGHPGGPPGGGPRQEGPGRPFNN